MNTLISRRALIAGLLAAYAAPYATRAAETFPAMTVYRDPGCSCCEGWVAHVRKAGFTATLVDREDMLVVKAKLRVPEALASCHTATLGDYVIEGHVPASAIARLLREKPTAFGLSAPGMPMGAPGMETDDPADTYDVVLFDATSTRRFARFRGAEAV